MTASFSPWRLPVVALVLTALLLPARVTSHSVQAPRPAALRIVVIAGEDAINVIQQKTALAPVVEVRDRNDQPVAGAVVRFAIRGGRATFNGARTLTVTTNAAGRAAVAGLTPTSSGALQITASAAFQGQAAAVTIAQTNVMTAAQAATASAAAGGTTTGAGVAGTATAGTATGAAAGATAGGAAAGAGTGMATSTVAIVGAAVGGGTLLATQVAGGDNAEGPPTTYTASFSFPIVFTITRFPGHPAGVGSCTDNRIMTGSLTITLDDPTASTIRGDGQSTYTQTTVAGGTCVAGIGTPIGTLQIGLPPSRFSGTAANFAFTLNSTGNDSGFTVFDIEDVTATLVDGAISAAVAYRGGTDSAIQQNRGSATFSLTLR